MKIESIRQFFIRNLRKVRIYNRLVFSYVGIIVLLISFILPIVFTMFTNEIKSQALDKESLLLNTVLENAKKSIDKYDMLFDFIESNNELMSLVKENNDLYSYIEDYVDSRIIYHNNRNSIINHLSDYIINEDEIESIYISSLQISYGSFFPWFNNTSGMPQMLWFSRIFNSPLASEGNILVVENKDYFHKEFGKKIIYVRKFSDLDYFLIIKFTDIFVENLLPNISQDSNLILKTKNNEIYYHNWKNRDVLNNLSKPLTENEIASIYEQKDHFVVESYIQSFNCYFYTIVSKSVLFSKVNSLYLIMIVVTILALLVSLIIAATVTNSISSPLKKLINDMNVASKTLVFEPDVSANDEVAEVSICTAEMVTKISTLIKELANKEIEIQKEEVKRKEFEISALQMQINPHFIYNTMEIIKVESLLNNNDKMKVANMIEIFSKLLRISTKHHNNLVSLKEEISHITLYLEVLGFSSYYNNLKLETLIEGVNIDNIYIPKFTLQPIIENSIKHGFSKLKKDKKIFIKVWEDENLHIVVKDNGKGFNLQALSNKQSSNGNIGLSNIRERIQILFGNKYDIHISNNNGACVEIILPIIKTQDLEDKKDV